MSLKNVSLRSTIAGIAVFFLASLTLEGILAWSGKSNRVATAVVLAGSYLVGAVVVLNLVRRLRSGVKEIDDRIDAVNKAAKANLMRGLSALAEGDLTVELHALTAASEITAHDELGEIQHHAEETRATIIACYDAYNKTTERLRHLVGNVSSTAGSVSAASQQMSATSEETGKATGEIAQAINEVAEGAERQARMAEEAKRSAEEIARAVAESAHNAERTAEVATNAHAVAQQGVDAAQKATDAMRSVSTSSQEVTHAISELAEKSERIGTIVHTITGIAEQTNLLALNAAIEAARAGEQGRGFAVVAEEVRKLAEDSQQAAHEISELIGTMQAETTNAVAVVEDGAQRTHDGVMVVQQAREAFLSIGQAVEDMDARIAQIAAAAEQISASATSMQTSVGKVAAVAEQSSASTEEVSASSEETSASAQQIAASSHELASNAEALNALVAQFKLAA